LTVRGVPRSDAERTLLSALGEDIELFRNVLSDYATELSRNPSAPKFESFRVTDEMRDQIYQRLELMGMELPRPLYDNASAYVDEQLGYEITRALFGPTAEARRRAFSDRQMQTAARILRRARTQDESLTIAATERARGTSR